MFETQIITYLISHARREQRMAGVNGDVAASIYWLSRSMALSDLLAK